MNSQELQQRYQQSYLSLRPNPVDSEMKSLKSRNTKNLSLSISSVDKSDRIPTSATSISSATTMNNIVPTRIHNITSKPPLLSRRSEASIYSSKILRSSENSPSSLNFTNISLNGNISSPTYKAANITTKDIHSTISPNNRNHSLSLSVNTQISRTHSRNRSKTIDTSTPLQQDVSRGNKSNLQIDSQLPLIPSHHIYAQQNDKTTWIFPETNGNIHADMKKKNDNDNENDVLYEDVYTKDAYPDGPLLVIPPNIYLYSEPNLDEILDFDLIINVAEEIPNLQYLIPPEFHGKIEYYHVEWSHQSKIVKDLKRLTEIMHKATLQNKKILIHCQCGVSRSASLMVAYIMRYCNMNVNDAYNRVKSIAKDISPNMGLIFQLMEWNEELTVDTNDDSKPDDIDYNKDSNDSSANNSSVNTSSDLTPKTPFGFSKGTDFTTLNT